MTPDNIDLRDFFAGLAMGAILTRPSWQALDESIAQRAYKQADAMLAERVKSSAGDALLKR